MSNTDHTKPAETVDITKSDIPTGNAESDSDSESENSNAYDYKPLEGEELLAFIKMHSMKHEGIEIPNIGNDSEHVRIYYSLEEAVNIIKASKNIKAAGAVTFTKEDLLHYAGIDKIRLVTVVPGSVDIYFGNSYQNYDSAPLTPPDLLVLKSSYCRQIECHTETEQSDFNDGFLIDIHGNVHSWTPISSDGKCKLVWRTRNTEEPIKIKITQDRLFVMSFDLASFIGGKLPQQWEPSIEQKPENIQETNAVNKKKQRFAVGREAVLQAAIYCRERWPNECVNQSGKIKFTAWAENIDINAYLFWPEGKLPLSKSEIERLLSEAVKYGDKSE